MTTRKIHLTQLSSSGASTNDIPKWNGSAWVASTLDGDKGDITVSSAGSVWTLDNNVVTLAKIAQISTATFLGRTSASTGNVESLSAAQATALLDTFTTTVRGLVPAPGTVTGKYLKDDGTWATVLGVSDGDKGDITVSGTGTTWNIDAATITLAKLADLAASSFIGNVTGGSATPTALTGTQATTLLDPFTTALKGLVPSPGTVTGKFLKDDGTWAIAGDLLSTNNLSDVANAATARGNLGAKAITPSIQSITSSATVTPTFTDDQVNITAQAVALALSNPTGTAVDGWGMAVRIKDNGTARAITYDTQYRAIGVTLPTTTVISKTLYLGMIFNSADTKWDVVAVAQEA